ncbi:hypothetical protein I8Y06_000815 [Photobacterium damselae]|nr:hypothetical protein [Photobacterium damselae]
MIQNHRDRQFAVTSSNRVWGSDVTYVWVENRKMYLAVLIYLFSRKLIDWVMSLSLYS